MDEAEFQKLLDAEPPLVLKPGVGIIFRTILLIALFILVGAWGGYVIHKSAIEAAFLAFVFGGLALAILSIPIRTILILHRDHFVVRELFVGTNIYLWKEVTDIVFQEKLVSGYKGLYRFFIIKFLYIPYGHCHEFERPPYKKITLPQLAQLMNHWRERALAAR